MILNYLESNFIILNILLIFFAFLLSFNASKIGLAFGLMDKPNSRKLHKGRIPSLGGLIIFLCFGIKLILENYFFGINDENIYFFIFSSILFFLGIIDDKYEINSYVKFFISIIILIISINFNLFPKIIYIHLEFLGVFWLEQFSTFFTILAFLLLLNALNMSDGINGYSISIFIILACFIQFKIEGVDSNLTSLILILIIILIFNFKNKIFLGDSGVYFLVSYLSCYFIELGNSNIKIYAEEILLIMFLPGLDMLRVFMIRIYNKSDPFKADRIHLHHILIDKLGWKKTYTILILSILIPILIKYITGISAWFFIIAYVTIYIYFIYKNKTSMNK